MTERARHTLTMLALAGGFVTLAIETRFEHRFVLAPQPIAWLPVFYGGLAAIAALAAACKPPTKAKPKATDWIISTTFALGVAVGGIGLLRHTDNNPASALRVLDVWTKPPSTDASNFGPPALAPLALAGFCVIALVVSWPIRKS